MSHPTPFCCSSTAYKRLAKSLPSIETAGGLTSAAVAIASHQIEEADAKKVDAFINGVAAEINGRVRGRQPQALLAHLHSVLFDELGFTGNRDDYYNPLNSYLPAVIENKKGMPITLAMVYHLVADKLGIRSWGVGLPGHFMAGINVDGQEILIDCFDAGRIVTVDEARDRVSEQFGDGENWSDEYLQPVTHREWLTRVLQNLLNTFSSSDRYPDVAAMLEMEMLLWPEHTRLQRDLGLVLARVGLSRPAGQWLDRYFRANPDDPQMSELRQLRKVLK